MGVRSLSAKTLRDAVRAEMTQGGRHDECVVDAVMSMDEAFHKALQLHTVQRQGHHDNGIHDDNSTLVVVCGSMSILPSALSSIRSIQQRS